MHMYRRITTHYEYVMRCLIKTEQVFVSGAHGFGGTTPPPPHPTPRAAQR